MFYDHEQGQAEAGFNADYREVYAIVVEAKFRSRLKQFLIRLVEEYGVGHPLDTELPLEQRLADARRIVKPVWRKGTEAITDALVGAGHYPVVKHRVTSQKAEWCIEQVTLALIRRVKQGNRPALDLLDVVYARPVERGSKRHWKTIRHDAQVIATVFDQDEAGKMLATVRNFIV